MAALEPYRQKRDFSRTPEPPPETAKRSGPLTFTIQKHAARRLHYDFRLEIDGVLVSWPIPRGPSYAAGERRLAVQTEDHPYEYGTFEGVIPHGEYGGGQVIVWDAGTYTVVRDDQPVDFHDRATIEALARKGLERGHLSVFLNGRKLKGGWTLQRTRGNGTKSQWLFMKRRDGLENAERDVTAEEGSVFSGLSIEDLARGVLPDRRAETLVPTAEPLKRAKRASFPKPYEPMLPTLARQMFQRNDWLYEPKLDGYRVLAFVDRGKVHLRSRGGQAYEGRYPEVVRALARQPFERAVLDGEVVAIGPDGRMSFQRLQNRAGDSSTVLKYYVFDLLYLDGYDLRQAALSDRKPVLHAALAPVGAAEAVGIFDDGLSLFHAAQTQGLEGVVAKKRDSVYEPGKRVRTWLKVKTNQADEFVIVGYTHGTGRRIETLGSLILGTYDASGKLRYAGHVGTGFDEATLGNLLRRLRPLRRSTSPLDEPVPRGGAASRAGGPAIWLEPKTVAEIKFSERTEDGRLRHPVFMRIREDKPPTDVRPQAVVAPPSSEDTPADDITAALQALDNSADNARVTLDGYPLRLTSLNKELWPAYEDRRALTKRDLVRFYLQIARVALPHLRDRQVTMTRFPNGMSSKRFYEKSVKEWTPEFVQRYTAYSDDNNADVEYFVCNNTATLVWLAQLADLELHVTHTRITNQPDAPRLPTTFTGSVGNLERSTLQYPDYLVTDIDPYIYSGKEARGAEPELNPEGFSRACEVALWYRELMEEIGLHPFIKTTGKTGLHLYVPIARTLDYDAVRAVAETFARRLLSLHPKEVTIEWSTSARRGKVFLDYNMNRRAASLAAPYSPRAVQWAGVSTPLRWEELDRAYPTQFHMLSVPERLGQLGDLWQSILDARVDLREMLSS